MNWIIGGAFGWLAGRSVRQGRQIRALEGRPPTRRERRRAAYRARRDRLQARWDTRKQVRA